MMTFFKIILASLLLNSFTFTHTLAYEQDLGFTARIRYADLVVGSSDGKAGSALFRLSLESKWSDHLKSIIELDHVETTLKNQHSDGVRLNGKPIIPDAPGSEINQLFLQYDGSALSLTAGRQAIELDNQRFIGNISFWQNEQTFDAGRINYKLFSSSEINYAYIYNANRIFGQDASTRLNANDIGFEEMNGLRPVSQLGDHEHNTHLIRLEFNEWDYSQLVAFSYLIDNKDQPVVSNDTFGLAYSFKFKPNNLHFRLEIEGATQHRPTLQNVENIPYYRLDFGLGLRSLEVSGQYEVLGSKNNVAFTTPLGSLHEFNGWADKFGGTPSLGLIDQSIKLKWRLAPWKLDIRFHSFKQQKDDLSLGTELDFDLSCKLKKGQEILLRFADFKASNNQENISSDVRRIILSYSYNF